MKKEKKVELENFSEKTDEELVAMALKNPDSYGFLVQRYEEKLLRYIMRISRSTKEDCEDILQDVFLSAYKKQVKQLENSHIWTQWHPRRCPKCAQVRGWLFEVKSRSSCCSSSSGGGWFSTFSLGNSCL